jgi:adenine/guanine phosphoribosyltransferase-like PRPP-binding protein
MVQTDYLASVYHLDRFQETVDRTIHAAERMMKLHPFDAIAFTGTSGAALAFILSHWMNVPLICVRKTNDGSHYPGYMGLLEGFTGTKRYMIVDDFISSGRTIDKIRDEIAKKLPQAQCIGIVLYARSNDSDYRSLPVFGAKEVLRRRSA